MTEDERTLLQALSDDEDGKEPQTRHLSGFALDDCLVAGWVEWRNDGYRVTAAGRAALERQP